MISKLLNSFYNLNIRSKITILGIMISLLPILIISLLYYVNYSSVLQNSILNSSKENTKYQTDYLNTYFDQIRADALQIYSYPTILTTVQKGLTYNSPNFMTQKDALNYYYSFIQGQNNGISSVIILDENHNQIDSWSNIGSYENIDLKRDFPYFNEIESLGYQQTKCFTYYNKHVQKSFVVYAINILDIFQKIKIGTIVFQMDYDQFKAIIEKYNQSPNVLILLNSDHTIIYHSSPDYDAKAIQNTIHNDLTSLQVTKDKNTLFEFTPLHNNGLVFGNITPLNELAQSNRHAIIITSSIVCILLLFIYLVSSLFQKNISEPIKSLVNSMREVRKGDFTIQMFDRPWKDEVSELYRSFNYMVKRLSDFIQSEFQLKLRNQEAQLIALQTQINPHFLNNTLQTIGGKAIIHGHYDINEMCKALSNIFRYSFYKGNKESTLHEELTHLNNYLYIQKMRFEDYLNVAFQIPKDFMACKMIRFVMQPVIENAIIHGLEKSEDSLSIEISAIYQESYLLIIVTDNGPGIDDEHLNLIKEQLNQEVSVLYTGQSVGLKNVHERLRIYYGSEYGVQIESSEGIGTKVTIMVPFNR